MIKIIETNKIINDLYKDRNISLDNVLRICELLEASPEAIVRCKDCMYWLNNHLCEHWSRFGTIETSAYAFCSYGRELK